MGVRIRSVKQVSAEAWPFYVGGVVVVFTICAFIRLLFWLGVCGRDENGNNGKSYISWVGCKCLDFEMFEGTTKKVVSTTNGTLILLTDTSFPDCVEKLPTKNYLLSSDEFDELMSTFHMIPEGIYVRPFKRQIYISNLRGKLEYNGKEKFVMIADHAQKSGMRVKYGKLTTAMARCVHFNSYLEISHNRVYLRVGRDQIFLKESVVAAQRDGVEKSVCILTTSLHKLNDQGFTLSQSCGDELACIEIRDSQLVASYGSAKLTVRYASNSLQIETTVGNAENTGDQLMLTCACGTAAVRFGSAMYPLNIWNNNAAATAAVTVAVTAAPEDSRAESSLRVDELLRMRANCGKISMSAAATKINFIFGVISLNHKRVKKNAVSNR